MGKFEDLYESIMKEGNDYGKMLKQHRQRQDPDNYNEGKEEVPNYRKAMQKDGNREPVCSECVHNDDGECKKFDFIFDRGWTFDAYEG